MIPDSVTMDLVGFALLLTAVATIGFGLGIMWARYELRQLVLDASAEGEREWGL